MNPWMNLVEKVSSPLFNFDHSEFFGEIIRRPASIEASDACRDRVAGF
jgi:hypothetical protein